MAFFMTIKTKPEYDEGFRPARNLNHIGSPRRRAVPLISLLRALTDHISTSLDMLYTRYFYIQIHNEPSPKCRTKVKGALI
jgi:hypothetical protein